MPLKKVIRSLAVFWNPTCRVTGRAHAAVQQLGAVELGGVGDTIDFLLQLLVLFVQGQPLGVAEGAVGGLLCQFPHTAEDVPHFREAAFRGLRHGDAVLGVADRDRDAADLRPQFFGDRQAGGVVLRAVDAKARGQPLHRGAQLAVVGRQVSLGG
jgi:hypothetical protein